MIAGTEWIVLQTHVGRALIELQIEGAPPRGVGVDQARGVRAEDVSDVVLAPVPVVAEMAVDREFVTVVVGGGLENRVPLAPAWSDP